MNRARGANQATPPSARTDSPRSGARRTPRHRSLLVGLACLAVLSPMGVVLTTQSASAVAPYERCSQPYQRVYSSSGGSVTWHSARASTTVKGGHGATMYAEASVSKSTSISGEVGLSDVSKMLGFAVERSWSWGTTSGSTFSVPKGKFGRVVLTMLRYQGHGTYMECQSYGTDGWRWFGPSSYTYDTYRKSSAYYEPQYSSGPSGPWR